jgi:hypothetical protein
MFLSLLWKWTHWSDFVHKIKRLRIGLEQFSLLMVFLPIVEVATVGHLLSELYKIQNEG